MKFVRTAKSLSTVTLEERINEILIEFKAFRLVDIKYSSAHSKEGTVMYSALLIFERVQS